MAEYVFIGLMFVAILLLSIVATIIFVRQYRIEMRDKAARIAAKQQQKQEQQRANSQPDNQA